MDMKEKTDQQIQNLIDNHRRVGKLDAPLAVAAVEEQTRRNSDFKVPDRGSVNPTPLGGMG